MKGYYNDIKDNHGPVIINQQVIHVHQNFYNGKKEIKKDRQGILSKLLKWIGGISGTIKALIGN
jgi:hypothetical protein